MMGYFLFGGVPDGNQWDGLFRGGLLDILVYLLLLNVLMNHIDGDPGLFM